MRECNIVGETATYSVMCTCRITWRLEAHHWFDRSEYIALKARLCLTIKLGLIKGALTKEGELLWTLGNQPVTELESCGVLLRPCLS